MIQDDGHDGDDDRQRDDLRVGLQPHCRKKFARWARMLTQPPSRLWALPSSLAGPRKLVCDTSRCEILGFRRFHKGPRITRISASAPAYSSFIWKSNGGNFGKLIGGYPLNPFDRCSQCDKNVSKCVRVPALLAQCIQWPLQKGLPRHLLIGM